MFGNPNQNRRRRSAGQTLMARLKSESGDRPRPWFVRLLIRTAFLAALTGMVAVAAWWLRDHWVYRIPALAIQEIVVEVDGVLAPEEVRRLSGVKIGRNILTVDLPALRDRLERHPRIATAKLVVEFPGTLSIHIRERFPLAAVEPLAGSGLRARYLLDDSGHVILPLNPAAAPAPAVAAEEALPRIVGRLSSVGETDQETLAALELLRAYERLAAGTLPEIASVDVSTPGLLVVTITDGAEVSFGAVTGTFDSQLRRWSDVRRQLAVVGETRTLRTLDLSVSQNAPIRWVESSPNQPASGTQDPPIRPRLKRTPRRTHV
jgi:cell division septal protein FtsQ